MGYSTLDDIAELWRQQPQVYEDVTYKEHRQLPNDDLIIEICQAYLDVANANQELGINPKEILNEIKARLCFGTLF